MPSAKAKQIEKRFRTIKQTLEELYGRDRAFATCAAVWLMTIEHLVKLGTRDTNRSKRLYQEIGPILQSLHKEICIHLDVNASDALKLARAFQEVIHDICDYKE